jgi:hypothetical protein
MKRAGEKGYISFATEGLEGSTFIPIDYTQYVIKKGDGYNDVVNDKTGEKIILASVTENIALYGYIAVVSDMDSCLIKNLRSKKKILECSGVQKVDVFSEFIVVYTKTKVYIYTHAGKRLTVSKLFENEGLAVVDSCTKKYKGKSYSHKALIDYKRGKVLINDTLKIDTAIEFLKSYIVVTALKNGKTIKEVYRFYGGNEHKLEKIIDESQNCIDIDVVPNSDVLVLDCKDKGMRVYDTDGKYLFEDWLKSSGLLNTHVCFAGDCIICTGYQLEIMVYDWAERKLDFKPFGSNCIEVTFPNGIKRYVTSVSEKEAGLKSAYN